MEGRFVLELETYSFIMIALFMSFFDPVLLNRLRSAFSELLSCLIRSGNSAET